MFWPYFLNFNKLSLTILFVVIPTKKKTQYFKNNQHIVVYRKSQHINIAIFVSMSQTIILGS